MLKKIIFVIIFINLIALISCSNKSERKQYISSNKTIVEMQGLEKFKAINESICFLKHECDVCGYHSHGRTNEESKNTCKYTIKAIEYGKGEKEIPVAIVKDEYINFDYDLDNVYVLYKNKLKIMDLLNNKEKELEIPKNSYIDIKVLDKEVFLLTKDGILKYNKNNFHDHKIYNYPGVVDIDQFKNGNIILLAISDNRTYNFVLIDSFGRQLLNYNPPYPVMDIVVSNDILYFLTNTKIYQCKHTKDEFIVNELINLYSSYDFKKIKYTFFKNIHIKENKVYINRISDNVNYIDLLTLNDMGNKERELSVFINELNTRDEIVSGIFLKNNPQVDLKIYTYKNIQEYDIKLNTALMSGKGPDVFILQNFEIYKYINNNCLLPLTQFFNNDDYFLNSFSMAYDGNHYYGYPSYISISGFIYNKPLFNSRKEFVDLSSTESFLQTCMKIKDKNINNIILPSMPKDYLLYYFLTGSSMNLLDFDKRLLNLRKDQLENMLIHTNNFFENKLVNESKTFINNVGTKDTDFIFYPTTLYEYDELERIYRNDMELLPIPAENNTEGKYIIKFFRLFAVNSETKNEDLAINYIKTIDRIGSNVNLVNRSNINRILEGSDLKENNKEEILNILNNTAAGHYLNIPEIARVFRDETQEFFYKGKNVEQAVNDIFNRIKFYLNE